MNTKTVFDIESCAAPDEQLALVMPAFEAAKNLVDPIKIAASIEKQKAAFFEQAALSAITGRVLCIGLLKEGVFGLIEGDESHILSRFWDLWRDQDSVWVGWNCKGFDMPFLVRRSWALDVPVPADVFTGRYFDNRLIDLMDTWCCGNRDQRESLDTVSKTLGIGAKNGSGADFARLWSEDKAKAELYLQNDLILCAALAKRMGVIE